MGKNFVSDGHFCKSFCPASHKISISGDFRHCCRVMIYLDCVMSKNHDLLQNKSLRNRLIMAASVMEFISTTPKNELVEKIFLQNQTKNHNFHKLVDIQIPVASVFQCFSTQIQFWVSCYSLHKKICMFPSLTEAVSITDTKNWRQKTRHFQCSKSNLEASFINLMGYKNIGINLVNSKKCFHSEKWCWNDPLFDHFFRQICLNNTK